jgi:hypothetical protein
MEKGKFDCLRPKKKARVPERETNRLTWKAKSYSSIMDSNVEEPGKEAN